MQSMQSGFQSSFPKRDHFLFLLLQGRKGGDEGETGGGVRQVTESRGSEEKPTFTCQLAVVWMFAGYYLLHQLVVAAVAHCFDNVMHLQTKIKTVGENIHLALALFHRKTPIPCQNIRSHVNSAQFICIKLERRTQTRPELLGKDVTFYPNPGTNDQIWKQPPAMNCQEEYFISVLCGFEKRCVEDTQQDSQTRWFSGRLRERDVMILRSISPGGRPASRGKGECPADQTQCILGCTRRLAPLWISHSHPDLSAACATRPWHHSCSRKQGGGGDS